MLLSLIALKKSSVNDKNNNYITKLTNFKSASKLHGRAM